MSEGAGNNEALAGSIVTARFAPASKMIVFSPEAVTVMSAVPVGPSTSRTCVTSTPWAAKSARRRWPDKSVPTAPTSLLPSVRQPPPDSPPFRPGRR